MLPAEDYSDVCQLVNFFGHAVKTYEYETATIDFNLVVAAAARKHNCIRPTVEYVVNGAAARQHHKH